MSPFSYSPDDQGSAWRPFDPRTESLPEALTDLHVPHRGVGAVIAVAVASAPDDREWSKQACVRVADMFGESVGGALLIDLEADRPSLHRQLGVSNAEGIADVLDATTSLDRVSGYAAGHRFRFVPAGRVSENPASILEHGFWGTLLPEQTRDGTSVVLHLPLAAKGAEAMLARADAVVLLGRRTDLLAVLVDGFMGPVVWFGPPDDSDSERGIPSASGPLLERRVTGDAEDRVTAATGGDVPGGAELHGADPDGVESTEVVAAETTAGDGLAGDEAVSADEAVSGEEDARGEEAEESGVHQASGTPPVMSFRRPGVVPDGPHEPRPHRSEGSGDPPHVPDATGVLGEDDDFERESSAVIEAFFDGLVDPEPASGDAPSAADSGSVEAVGRTDSVEGRTAETDDGLSGWDMPEVADLPPEEGVTEGTRAGGDHGAPATGVPSEPPATSPDPADRTADGSWVDTEARGPLGEGFERESSEVIEAFFSGLEAEEATEIDEPSEAPDDVDTLATAAPAAGEPEDSVEPTDEGEAKPGAAPVPLSAEFVVSGTQAIDQLFEGLEPEPTPDRGDIEDRMEAEVDEPARAAAEEAEPEDDIGPGAPEEEPEPEDDIGLGAPEEEPEPAVDEAEAPVEEAEAPIEEAEASIEEAEAPVEEAEADAGREELAPAPALSRLEAEFEGLPQVADRPAPRRRSASPVVVVGGGVLAAAVATVLLLSRGPAEPPVDVPPPVPPDATGPRASPGGADPQAGDPLRVTRSTDDRTVAAAEPETSGESPAQGMPDGDVIGESDPDELAGPTGPPPDESRDASAASVAGASGPATTAEPSPEPGSEDSPARAATTGGDAEPDPPVPPAAAPRQDPALQAEEEEADAVPAPDPVAEASGRPATVVTGAGSTDPSPPPPNDAVESGPMTFGVVAGQHGTLPAAERQAASLGAELEDALVSVVPVDDGGMVYRVVAGAAATAEGAEAVQARLGGPAAGAVRSLPWAYLLGVFEDFGDAVTMQGRADGDGIPAYLVEVPVGEDRVIYRVYAGAFASQEEAAPLGALLDAAGYGPPRLTDRIGRPLAR